MKYLKEEIADKL